MDGCPTCTAGQQRSVSGPRLAEVRRRRGSLRLRLDWSENRFARYGAYRLWLDRERVKQINQGLVLIVVVEFNDLKHYVLETSDLRTVMN
jgi:hypothetical protein